MNIIREDAVKGQRSNSGKFEGGLHHGVRACGVHLGFAVDDEAFVVHAFVNLHGRLNALSGDIAEKLLRLVACYVVGCKVLRQVLVGELHREGGVGVGRINREGAGLLAFVSGEIRGEANRAGTRQLLNSSVDRLVGNIHHTAIEHKAVERNSTLTVLSRRIGRNNGRRRPLCAVLDGELHIGHGQFVALNIVRKTSPSDNRVADPIGIGSRKSHVDIGINART